MPMKLDQAMVVITGASRGIGQATAEAFARLGSHLVLASRNACALEAVAENGRRLSGRAIWYVTDVTDPSTVDSLAKKAASLGNIDVWVSFERAVRVDTGDGNLLSASPDAPRIDGGMRRRPVVPVLGITMGVAFGLAALVAWQTGRRAQFRR